MKKYFVIFLFLATSLPVLVLAMSDGSGTMIVSPTIVNSSTSGLTFVFTYQAPSSGSKFDNDSFVRLVIPVLWTAPQISNASNPGYVSVAEVGSGQNDCNPGSVTITGSGPWSINIPQRCNENDAFNITYGAGSSVSKVTSPSTGGVYTFSAFSQNGNSGLAALALSPTVTVNAKTATTLSAISSSGTYGETVNLSATLSPAVSGKTIAFSLNGSSVGTATTNASGVATLNSVTLGSINASSYPTGVDANFAGDSTYAASSGSNTLTVNQRPITVTAVHNEKEYDGGINSGNTPTITSGSLINGNTASWTQTYDTKDVGTGKILAPNGTINDGNSGNNYVVTFVNDTTGVITPIAISVTADPDQKKIFGTADPELKYHYTGSLIEPDRFEGVLDRTSGEDVGSYPIGQGTLVLNSNYSLTFNSNNFSITPADATITLGNLSQDYTGAPLSVSVVSNPENLSHTITYVGSSVVYGPTTDAPTNAGTYSVSAVSNDPNYSGSDNGTLTIYKVNPNITVSPYDVVYDGNSHTATVLATGAKGEDLSGSINLTGTTHTDVGNYPEDLWIFTDINWQL